MRRPCPDDGPDFSLRAPVSDLVEATRAALEAEFAPWTYLAEVNPVEAEVSAELEGGATDPWRVDEELRRLASMRAGWDELVGHLAMLLRLLGLWRDMQFESFSHYCAERLGMAARTVEQRAALERRLYALPALRQAMREGRVSYEKARVIAEHADDTSVEEWIRRAEGTTCIALRREVDTHREAQMCARAELDLRVPRRVGALLVGGDAGRAGGLGPLAVAGRVPRAGGGALHRDLEGRARGAEHAAEAGHGAGRRSLPGAGLQPGGGRRAPRLVPVARRSGRRGELHLHVQASPPPRHTPWVHPRHRLRAGWAEVGAGNGREARASVPVTTSRPDAAVLELRGLALSRTC